jgi:hypothetical protein
MRSWEVTVRERNFEHNDCRSCRSQIADHADHILCLPITFFGAIPLFRERFLPIRLILETIPTNKIRLLAVKRKRELILPEQMDAR